MLINYTIVFFAINGEEEIDIWKIKIKQVIENNEPANDTSIQKLNKDSIKSIEINQNIKIEIIYRKMRKVKFLEYTILQKMTLILICGLQLKPMNLKQVLKDLKK